ncbi:hypothetical protein GRX01_10525 [Halobaculum sp. WSA2]|uniref:Roadblock/LAMTOR2 domain-containing protein n=1 Tax=Halobaculum saliterrae TaxID=2073113 RepID=A0A6B0SS52_9EURY|nr:hypothetical protein [Halobaculum saliterrae]MXR41768.1 hypothetical protein [Halobaculum saliterrae]
MTGGDEVVSFDVDAATAAIRDALDDGSDLHVVAAFTAEAYEIVHCDEFTRAFYADDEEMGAHFDRIHRYAGIDFSEIGLFVDELFPVAGGVEYVATGMEHLTIVRVYTGREGLLLTLDPGVDVTTAIEAVRDAIDRDLGATGDSLSSPDA